MENNRANVMRVLIGAFVFVWIVAGLFGPRFELVAIIGLGLPLILAFFATFFPIKITRSTLATPESWGASTGFPNLAFGIVRLHGLFETKLFARNRCCYWPWICSNGWWHHVVYCIPFCCLAVLKTSGHQAARLRHAE